MKYTILALSLMLAPLHAEPTFQVSGQLNGYKLPGNEPSTFHVAATSAASSTFGVWMERPYPSKFQADRIPSEFEKQFIGFYGNLTVQKQGDHLFYIGNVSLTEVSPHEGSSVDFPSRSARTPFKGTAMDGKSISIPILTPQGKTAHLRLVLKQS